MLAPWFKKIPKTPFKLFLKYLEISHFCLDLTKFKVRPTSVLLLLQPWSVVRLIMDGLFLLALPTKGKDNVFRFIIEDSSLRGFGPY
jgi:hypothetical protein